MGRTPQAVSNRFARYVARLTDEEAEVLHRETASRMAPIYLRRSRAKYEANHKMGMANRRRVA